MSLPIITLTSFYYQRFIETTQKMAYDQQLIMSSEEYRQMSYVSSQLFSRLPFLSLYYDRAAHIFCARVAKWRFRSRTAPLIGMKSMHCLGRCFSL